MFTPSLMIRYHLRIVKVYLQWRLAGKVRSPESRLTFRASPFDCDWLGHINNARYLEYLDAGRSDLMLRLGLFQHASQNKWHAVVGTINVRYRKEVRGGQKFTLVTRFDRLEGKAMVFHQQILLGDTVATNAECFVIVVRDKRAADPSFLLPLLQADEKESAH